MKEQYRVWCPDNGEAEDDCVLLMAYDHEEAAREVVEKSYHEEPFDCPMTVHVRCTFGGDDGELRIFSVHPEPTISFYSYEVRS
ncbi:hypothetical protein H5V43_01685 [Sphingobium fuliginis]|jgi:hypothetical protein|uniref:Uncharacterized protein n=1 Tax=Sphingobium fuliginis (strain ATCC 27551) TaxID=336203 RepID=A0A7M2GGR8_SPHSA|nr:hypothetical protein [Sphingobium fuliginis]QOT71914.1 hypothetical protein H5V43_01685 [Sphingobium fuliginis]